MERAAPWSDVQQQRRVMSPDAAWSDPLIARILDGCHPKQRDFVLDPADQITARVGRGGGKTTGVKARLLIRMLRQERAQCVFVAETRPQAERLLWEPLKTTCEKLGLVTGKDVYFNESKLHFRVKRTGSFLQLVGADKKSEIDKLRGQPFDEAAIDEAAIHNETILEWLVDRIIGPRLRGPIVLTSTPYHVLRGYFYDGTRPGSPKHRPYSERDDPKHADTGWSWSSHFWTLADPECQAIPELRSAWARALKKKAGAGWADDSPVWKREYLGEWSADNTGRVYQYRALVDGKPFNMWDPPRLEAKEGQPNGFVDLAKACPDIKDWHYSIALDKGNVDPFACNVFAFSPQDPAGILRHVWGMEKLKGMYAYEVSRMLIGEEATERMLHSKEQGKLGGVMGVTGWPDGFIADADQAMLDELTNRYGIKIAKAERNRDSKVGGIELVNGDLIAGKILVLKDSALEQQLSDLQWKPDDDGILKEDSAQANHSSDTLVYARRAVAHMLIRESPDEDKKRPTSVPYRDPQGLDDGDDESERPRTFDSLYQDDDIGHRWSGDDE